MATGQHKKTAQIYFHCDPLEKMINRKWKEKYEEEI